jgi:hypothetical protein
VGDLAERDTASEALLLDALPIGGIGHVLGHEPGGLDVGAALVVGTVRDAPPATGPCARFRVAVEPSGTDAALDLLAVQSPERFVEGSAAVLADQD